MSDVSRVIVAGAGPVGLTVALTLAQVGVPVTVLEKREGVSAASKASTFHPPTLAILEHLGVLAPVLAQGTRVDRLQYRTADGGIFAEFPLDALRAEARFPFRLHLEQAQVTKAMLEKLERHSHADVVFDAELTDVALAENRVTANLRSADGSRVRSLDGAYLVGADGSRSQVREALGIAFDGDIYPDRVLRVMTDDALERVLPGIAPVTYLFNGGKSVSFLRMPDCWRIILRVAREIDDDAALAPDAIGSRLREAAPAFERLPHVVMKDIYAVSKRVAARYHQGRAVLAGDSAHVTNTRGGMNMNCGIHDGFAIARSILEALAVDRPEIVWRAAEERRRIANELLIPRTDRNVVAGQAWHDTLRHMAASEDRARAHLRTTAMLDMVPAPDDPLYLPTA